MTESGPDRQSAGSAACAPAQPLPRSAGPRPRRAAGRPLALAAALQLGLAATAFAQGVEIYNDYGSVSVEVVVGQPLDITRAGRNPGTAQGVRVRRVDGHNRIEVLPPVGDGADLGVRVPLGTPFAVETDGGDITVLGMVGRAHIQTNGGAVTLAVPLAATRLEIEATARPARVDLAKGHNLRFDLRSLLPGVPVWQLSGGAAREHGPYGHIRAVLHRAAALTVRDWPVPEDWPVRPHNQAAAAVRRLRARAGQRPPAPRPAAAPGAASAAPGVFTSEVRMVSMSVAVSDARGRPVTDLTAAEFAVEENGQPQRIRVAGPEQSPFNMAILLDLSNSTSTELEHMRQATLRLIEQAGPHDRVAVYALAGSMFHKLAALTADRERLAALVRRLPRPSGGSPLWDAIVLAYEEELAARAGERNALIVISDGIDNRISGHSMPSVLSAPQLLQAARAMDARIYPIFLLSGELQGRDWSQRGRQRLQALAQATGGKLFAARSVADIEPVLPALAQELRSVYGLAYYPANQAFDGAWRAVTVRVSRPRMQVRARAGYFAE